MGAADGAAASGLRDAAQQVVASLIDLGRNRLELVTIEFEEERLYLARLWIGATVALFLLFAGLGLAAAWIVLLCEPANRPAVLGGLGALFLGSAAIAGWRWRRLALEKPAFLHATLGELRRDRAALDPGGPR